MKIGKGETPQNEVKKAAQRRADKVGNFFFGARTGRDATRSRNNWNVPQGDRFPNQN